MSISNRQNEKKSIDFLAAQRIIYLEAKKLRTIRIIGSFGLTIVAPFIMLFFPLMKSLLGIIGGIWTVIAFILSSKENTKVKEAATIQEEFDTYVFELDWNNIQCGHKISNEIIHAKSEKYKEKYKLKDWYGKIGGIDRRLSIIICQRSNLVWDWRLRKQFAWVIIISLLGLLGIGITIALYNCFSLMDYLVSIIIPSASALILGIKEIKEHFESANSKEALEKKINSIWENTILSEFAPSEIELRQIQDKIFQLRLNNALIPEWWFNRLRKEYEFSMQKTINRYITEAIGKSFKNKYI